MGEGAALGHRAEGLTDVQVPEGLVEQDLLLAPQGHVAQPAPVPGLALGASPLTKCPSSVARGGQAEVAPGVGTADRPRSAGVPGALPRVCTGSWGS